MKHRIHSMQEGIYYDYSKRDERVRTFVQIRVYCEGELEAVPLRDRLVREVNLWIKEEREKQAQSGGTP